MEVIKRISMDLATRGVHLCVDAVQGDGNTRTLVITLTENGDNWIVPDETFPALAYRKPDGTSGLYDKLPSGASAASISANRVTMVLAPQVMSVPGKVEAALVLLDRNMNQLAAFPFTILVAPNPAAGQGISNNYYNYQTLGDINKEFDAINGILAMQEERFAAKTAGKNKFDKNSSSIVSGFYVDYATGQKHKNDNFEYCVIPCPGNTTYTINVGYCHIAWYSGYPDIVSRANYIGGHYVGKTAKTFSTGANAKYIALSYPISAKETLQLELGDTQTPYEPYSLALDGNGILDGSIGAEKLTFAVVVTNAITVDINGGGDFTSLKDAFDSITDATSKNRYVVKIKEGVYDVRSYYTDAQWAVEDSSFVGLRVPDFVSLEGVGNKENVIITAADETQRKFVSTLNLQDTCSLKNLTVKAKNLRYTVHDDFAQPRQESYERLIENCDFYGENLQLVYVYGCGLKQGAKYSIKNCLFHTDAVSNFSLLIHNNVDFAIPAFVEIENCRFEPYETAYGCVFASMGTETKLTYITLKGNKMQRLRLNENSAATYGKGISIKVSGYGNIIDKQEIVNTDDADYSGYINLI